MKKSRDLESQRVQCSSAPVPQWSSRWWSRCTCSHWAPWSPLSSSYRPGTARCCEERVCTARPQHCTASSRWWHHRSICSSQLGYFGPIYKWTNKHFASVHAYNDELAFVSEEVNTRAISPFTTASTSSGIVSSTSISTITKTAAISLLSWIF